MPTAVEMILNIAELEGPGMDHKGSFEVIAFRFGVSTNEAATGGGGGAGKAMLEDLVVVKQIDPLSPNLMLACATGRTYKEATFTILPAVRDGVRGGNGAMYKLEDVIVESVRQMGNENGGEFPTEEVTFDAAKLTRFDVGPKVGLG